MNRTVVLGSVILAGTLSMVVEGQAPVREVAPTVRINERLFVIPGTAPAPGTNTVSPNTTVFLVERGVVVVDTKTVGFGPTILARIKEITSKPVIMIINTHTHNDHTGSNTEFPGTIQFVAHANTKKHLEEPTCPPVTNCASFKGDNAKYLPSQTFTDKLTLFGGKDQIDLHYFGAGHTDGDAWVVYPSLRAMNSGDQFASKITPSIDTGNGGSALSLASSLAKAVATVKNVETVIPGHGPVMKWSDLEGYSRFYNDLVATVRKGKGDGKTVDEIAKAYTLPPGYFEYQGQSAPAPSVRANVELIYKELSR
jgi:glyoxylase-like metal-dependent hydrolase (beta-lactamase superfamily II)